MQIYVLRGEVEEQLQAEDGGMLKKKRNTVKRHDFYHQCGIEEDFHCQMIQLFLE